MLKLCILPLVFICFVGGNECHETSNFIYYPNTNILGGLNLKGTYAAFRDQGTGLCGLLNGITGFAIFHDIETGEAVYVTKEESDKTWQKKTAFKDFLKSIDTKALYELGQTKGFLFDAASITNDLRGKMGEILGGLSKDFSSSCNAFATSEHLSRRADDLFKKLTGFGELFGEVITKTRGDFKWFNGVLGGLLTLFGKVQGGLEDLKSKGVSLDLKTIMEASSGPESLGIIIKQIGEKFDNIVEVFPELNDPVFVLTVIEGLGGGVSYGLDGTFTVVSEIVKFVKGKVSIKNVEVLLKEYFSDKRTNIETVKKEFTSCLSKLKKIIEAIKGADALKDITEALEYIIGNKWTLGGVKISEAITILIEPKSKLASTIATNKIIKIISKNSDSKDKKD